MKAYLLYRDRDFGFGADLPAAHEDLIQDLELATLLRAMADGDKLIYQVAEKVLLTSLRAPAAIRYRQQVLADCLAQPEVVREMYSVAVSAETDRRQIWGGYGGTYQTCGRCSPPCNANWETTTSRRSATTSRNCASRPAW